MVGDFYYGPSATDIMHWLLDMLPPRVHLRKVLTPNVHSLVTAAHAVAPTSRNATLSANHAEPPGGQKLSSREAVNIQQRGGNGAAHVLRYATATLLRPAAATYLDVDEHPGRELLGDEHGVALAAAEAQGVGRVPREVLQGDDAHAHQVAAVDALVALRQHRLDALVSTVFIPS